MIPLLLAFDKDLLYHNVHEKGEIRLYEQNS